MARGFLDTVTAIIGPPAIAPGIGAALAEAVFVSGGKVFHPRFNSSYLDLANASWSASSRSAAPAR